MMLGFVEVLEEEAVEVREKGGDVGWAGPTAGRGESIGGGGGVLITGSPAASPAAAAACHSPPPHPAVFASHRAAPLAEPPLCCILFPRRQLKAEVAGKGRKAVVEGQSVPEQAGRGLPRQEQR